MITDPTLGGVYVALGVLVLLAVRAVRTADGDDGLGFASLGPLLPLLLAFAVLVLVHAWSALVG